MKSSASSVPVEWAKCIGQRLTAAARRRDQDPSDGLQRRRRAPAALRTGGAAAALTHPNILAVFDVRTQDSTPYIVSELLDGETLRERLAAGPLPVRKAVETAVRIAHGLAAAHEKGVIHRDLKPENVFLTTDGRYVRSFPEPGGKRQISKDDAIAPRWRGDGEELFYYGSDGRLMAVPIRGRYTLDVGTAVPLFDARLLNGPPW